MRSTQIGPPSVASYTGFVLSIRGSRLRESFSGSLLFHFSFVKLVRNEPDSRLPPDFVIVETTPPVKRPYSAEMLPVRIVVSWIASSMNRSCGCPRRFSLTTTPLMRKRLSKDGAPAIAIEASRSLPPGPLLVAPGASSTVPASVRAIGSFSTKDAL